MKRICIFCGSSSRSRPDYRAAAEEMAADLVRRNLGLVYGGGNVGLMGILAAAVLRAGGEAIGVISEHLMAREVGHKALTKLHVVHTMHERKTLAFEFRSTATISRRGTLRSASPSPVIARGL
jgi:uncharacterized protein (TIGR00730 family)